MTSFGDLDQQEKAVLGRMTLKAKEVVGKILETQKQQRNLIKGLQRECGSLRAEALKMKASEEMKEQLLVAANEKVLLHSKRLQELEELLENFKIRERSLMGEIKESSQKLECMNVSIESNNSAHARVVADYEQQLSSMRSVMKNHQRQLQEIQTKNTNLRNEIMKLNEARKKNPDSAIVSLVSAYQKKKKELTDEYNTMLQENLKRHEDERSRMQVEFDCSKRALLEKCAEKDNQLEEKELMLQVYKSKEEGQLCSMMANMGDLRMELSNQIQVNGRLKAAYESLRVGTNMKIRSLQRKIRGVEGGSLHMERYLNCSQDIQKIKKLLANESSDNDITWTTENSLKKQGINLVTTNVSGPKQALSLKNSPAFNRSMESAMKKKRAFEGTGWITQPKRRRKTLKGSRGRPYHDKRKIKEEFDYSTFRGFGIDDSDYCSLM